MSNLNVWLELNPLLSSELLINSLILMTFYLNTVIIIYFILTYKQIHNSTLSKVIIFLIILYINYS